MLSSHSWVPEKAEVRIEEVPSGNPRLSPLCFGGFSTFGEPNCPEFSMGGEVLLMEAQVGLHRVNDPHASLHFASLFLHICCEMHNVLVKGRWLATVLSQD